MKKVKALYDAIHIGKNDNCLECMKQAGDRRLSKPLGMWHVGSSFATDPYKVLFVGKPHRGTPYLAADNISYPEATNEIISTEDSEYGLAENCATALFMEQSWPYWSYTRELAGKLYGTPRKQSWDRIAMTNIAKCTVSAGVDKTHKFMKQFCIVEVGVLWHEIITVAPSNVILFLGRSYDDYITNDVIQNLFPEAMIDEVTNSDASVDIGNKKCWWWHRNIQGPHGLYIRFLRISHPERMKKDDYITRLCNWIE